MFAPLRHMGGGVRRDDKIYTEHNNRFKKRRCELYFHLVWGFGVLNRGLQFKRQKVEGQTPVHLHVRQETLVLLKK